MPVLVERMTNRGDRSIHHPTRCNERRASCSVRHAGLCEMVERFVIRRLAVDQNTAAAVRGILAQAHVCDDRKIRLSLSRDTNRPNDDAVIAPCARANDILDRWYAEKDNSAYPQ